MKRFDSPLLKKNKDHKKKSSQGSQINFDVKSVPEWSQNDNKKILLVHKNASSSIRMIQQSTASTQAES